MKHPPLSFFLFDAVRVFPPSFLKVSQQASCIKRERPRPTDCPTDRVEGGREGGLLIMPLQPRK